MATDATRCTHCGYSQEVAKPFCPLCCRSFDDSSRYCIYDGTALARSNQASPTCPTCNSIYAADIKYCIKDGAKLEARYHTPDALLAGFYFSYPRASLGKRFAAALLDSLLIMALCIPSFFCMYRGLSDPYSDVASNWYFLAILFYFVVIIYSLIKDGLGAGQSPGKRAAGIMLVSLGDNWPCDKSRSAGRNLVVVLITVIPYIIFFATQSPIAALLLLALVLIDPLMVLLRNDGRKLGDLMAKTQVIDTQNYRRNDLSSM